MRFHFSWLVLALLIASCGSGPAAPPDDGRPQVVVTFSVLADIVRRVGGEEIGLTTLVDPGADAHTFEPAPIEARALTAADLIFQNGLGFEPWLEDLMASTESTARRVVVSEGMAVPDVDGKPDPHVWQDVANVQTITQRVRDALIELDPGRADHYRANAEAYLAELQALDAWVQSEVSALPAERRKLVTTHDTFAYFARRYGFELVGTALGSATTEVAEPSAQAVGQLVDEIRAAGIPVIFGENVANPALMTQIANEAGVRLGPPLYTDALGEPGSPGDTYLGMMRYNVTTIVQALK